MNIKISEKWKRPFRLALVIVAIIILTMANKYYVQFSVNFSFGSQPVKTEAPDIDSRRTALEILNLGHPVIRH
ncbi:hypothetical protein LCGC14_0554080 [marine sediment metagenome]|uniref:Uncharacterized protein n=1 Tax=marine sediment metagenome TaxID=412755 RepID=A0A0F9S7R1_9ZZZZ